MYEAELEQINSAKKKKKDSGAQKWEDLLERCRYHEERLELVLRLIDNESLSPEDVDNIKDQLDYLLEQVLNAHPQNEWSQVAPFLPQKSNPCRTHLPNQVFHVSAPLSLSSEPCSVRL